MSVEVWIGPMFAGKTSRLLCKARQYAVQNKKVLYLKKKVDTRYDATRIVTHDLWTEDAHAVTFLSELPVSIDDYEVIAIDEGQFFPELKVVADKWATQGKVVLVSALNCDYQRRGFQSVLQLVAIAEKVHSLNAICIQCYRDAQYTYKIKTKKIIKRIEIGGGELYEPRCRACWKNVPSAK